MAGGKIFISYRRGTDGNSARLLYDQLGDVFGRERLFFDVDSIPPGIDFVEHLDSQVAQCEAFIAVIGPTWLSTMDRLHGDEDFVRIEIESALDRQGIPVIPLLVDGAQMPFSEELPEPLRPLVRRNGIPVIQRYFDTIIERELIPELRKVLHEPGGFDNTGDGRLPPGESPGPFPGTGDGGPPAFPNTGDGGPRQHAAPLQHTGTGGQRPRRRGPIVVMALVLIAAGIGGALYMGGFFKDDPELKRVFALPAISDDAKVYLRAACQNNDITWRDKMAMIAAQGLNVVPHILKHVGKAGSATSACRKNMLEVIDQVVQTNQTTLKANPKKAVETAINFCTAYDMISDDWDQRTQVGTENPVLAKVLWTGWDLGARRSDYLQNLKTRKPMNPAHRKCLDFARAALTSS